MGLNSLMHDTPFFEFVDESDCPRAYNGLWSGACLGPDCWQNGEPINCDEGGTKCVGISSDGLINDVACTDTRNAILCSMATTAAKQIGEVSLNINDNDNDGLFSKHPDSNIPMMGWLEFAALVVLVLGLNACGCYYCLCRDSEKKEIADNSLIEYPNKL